MYTEFSRPDGLINCEVVHCLSTEVMEYSVMT